MLRLYILCILLVAPIYDYIDVCWRAVSSLLALYPPLTYGSITCCSSTLLACIELEIAAMHT